MSTINKHAYLIIAHGNPFVLEKLLLLLDDVRNDIYIHIDKKTVDFDFNYFLNIPQKSNIKCIDSIDVYWGHVSQIEVELKLFRAAFENGDYTYYHLVSGADLPIKSQDYMHRFFEENSGKEFIGFSNALFDKEKINKIHLFPKYMRVGSGEYLQRIARKVRVAFLSFQRFFGYTYGKQVNVQFAYGSNWVSITSNLVKELLKNEKWFLHFYRHSACCDEVYKHTFVYSSVYRNAIYAFDDELRGCMRFMDWKRGRPYTFRNEDFDFIMSSGMLFARKFEDAVDEDIVESIYKAVKAK